MVHRMMSVNGKAGSGTWTLYVNGFNLTDEKDVDFAGSHSMVPLARVVTGGVKLEF